MPPSEKCEVAIITLLAWALMVLIFLRFGAFGFSWDALNHHIYLGWMAHQSRLHLDLWPAASQSYQYPYLYLPIYELYSRGVSGTVAGVAVISLNSTAIPAVWLISNSLVAERSWTALIFRFGAVFLAFSSALVLSTFTTTVNDFFAGLPMLWAIALALIGYQRAEIGDEKNFGLAAAFLMGVSVGFKVSNIVIAVAFPILWFHCVESFRARRIFLLALWSLCGYLLAYGYWGWKMWSQFGDPYYPLLRAVLK
ncbi:hypothetical protein QTH90_12240 [Variovorax sp. J2P1-59]|uniref:hypothetical protein n=1 Tax=Variovorax flavidus TaxID=3053501 RepID=UPI002575258D|nr:hypothetical protein [Variovorax sp. J2P1-59]MDM0075158.1 hypothetical protein [Variovorax sp. J2P1-59]